MSRKTHKAAAIAVAATLITTFALAESSSIAAESAVAAIPTEISNPAMQDAANPAFIAEEVVQPLPVEEPIIESAEVETASVNAGSLRELVSATNTSGNLSRDMHCLASAIYFESRGEPLDGQLAVGTVIVNRAESRVFPSDYCGVVTQRSQFSFVKGGRIPKARTSTAAWRKAKALAKIAHEGIWESAAANSLYFHATYVKPRWARKKTARAQISTHVFYR